MPVHSSQSARFAWRYLSIAAACAVRRVSLLRVTGRHHRLDVASDVEVTDDLHEAGIEQRHEVIEDSIHGGLVEDLPVAKLVDVELQRLEFDQLLVGDVSDADGGEIGESGIGCQAGELGNREVDLVVTLRFVVRDRLQGRLGDHLRPVFHRTIWYELLDLTRCFPSLTGEWVGVSRQPSRAEECDGQYGST